MKLGYDKPGGVFFSFKLELLCRLSLQVRGVVPLKRACREVWKLKAEGGSRAYKAELGKG